MTAFSKCALVLAAWCCAGASVWGDEIKLKDGKKLYGVIVGYEDNMFRVKTDYGFVLVEKDKIAAIVPSTPASATPAPSTTAKAPSKPAADKAAEEAARQSAMAATAPEDSGSEASTKPKISDAPVKPSLPATTNAAGKVTPPAIKPSAAPAGVAVATAQPLAPPKEPELPANREEVQGTLYINYSHGFRMYKAPSWELIEDARKALPNAIVAMGTSNESTLMVVGQEKLKDSLDASAANVEKRLRDIYSNYRVASQRKTLVGGSPAVEYKFLGKADEHEWSGTLVVIERGKEVMTMLGMTYAESDLIQIQENVIARAIASTDFNVPKLAAEK